MRDVPDAPPVGVGAALQLLRREVSWRAPSLDRKNTGGAGLGDRARAGARAVRRVRNLLRLLDAARRGELVSVPLSACTNEYAFNFAEGWHYFRDLASELEREPDVPPETTAFYQFFQRCEFPSYTRVMAFHDPALARELPEIPFGSWPWGHWAGAPVGPARAFRDTSGIRRNQDFMWFEAGPDRDRVLRKEFTQVRRLLRSIQQHGLRLSLSAYRVPIVVPMVASSGRVRFMPYDGAHRLAVLSAVGHTRALVRFDRQCPPVREEEVAEWMYVRHDLVDERAALRLFDLYFVLDGRERASSLVPGRAVATR